MATTSEQTEQLASSNEASDPAVREHHLIHRSPWLRAMILGANDGLVTVASVMIGVGAAAEGPSQVVVSGLSALVAGSCSMGIGEYVSVHSQKDTQLADIQKEREEHSRGPAAQAAELEELTQIYVSRGLYYDLARRVAVELSKDDPVRAHAIDELGIDVDEPANPVQACVVSAASFTIGGLIPFLSALPFTDLSARLVALAVSSTVAFVVFGIVAAVLGGAKITWPATRTLVGGWIALTVAYVVMTFFGAEI